MTTQSINQPTAQSTNEPTNALTLHYLGDRQPTIGDMHRMRAHAADTVGRLDGLADMMLENFMFAVSTGHDAMARQAAFDLETVRLIRDARK